MFVDPSEPGLHLARRRGANAFRQQQEMFYLGRNTKMFFSACQRFVQASSPYFPGLPAFLNLILNAFPRGSNSLGSPAKKPALRPSSRLIFASRPADSNFRSILLFVAMLVVPGYVEAVTPTLTAPIAGNIGANTVTLTLQSDQTGKGYFVLQSGATCGTGAQVQSGLDNGGAAALRIGSAALAANTAATYALRNLSESTTYHVCFTADDGSNLQGSAASTSFTTNAPATLGAGWNTLGTLPGVAWAWMDMDAAGTPYLAYKDASNTASVKKFSGAFSLVGAAGLSPGQIDYVPIAIAPDGTPYVFFNDRSDTANYRGTVMKFDGATWVTVGNTLFTSGTPVKGSLVFAPDGTPYVAYASNVYPTSDYTPEVMKLVGGTWTQVGVNGDFATVTSSYAVSLALGFDGTPYIAYLDGSSAKKMTVRKFTGGAWNLVGTAGFSAGQVADISLAFNPASGYPYVSYYDYANAGKGTLMAYNGAAWAALGSAGFTPSFAQHTALSFSPSGVPYVAYQDGTGGAPYKVSVMKYSGAWTQVGSAQFSNASSYLRLGFENSGVPILVGWESGVGLSLFKFATITTVPGAPTGASATAGNAQLSVSFSAPASDGGSAIDSYTVTCADGSTTPSNSGSASPITISGLTNGTSYTCTVTAHNANGNSSPSAASAGAIPTPQPPTATTNPASGISSTGATLNGTVSANGASTTVIFQYDLPMMDRQPLWQAVASQSPLAANAANASVSASISGLTCNTTYQYRVSATNNSTTTGIYSTFTTSACAAPSSPGGDYTPPPPLPPPAQTPNGNSTPVSSAGAVVTNPDSHVTLDGNGALVIAAPPATPYLVSQSAPDNALILLPPNQPVSITADGVTLTYIDKSGNSQLMVRNLDGHPKLEVGYGNVEIRSSKKGNIIPVVSDNKHKLVAVLVTASDGDNVTIVRKGAQARVYVDNGTVEYQGTGQDQAIPVYEGENGQIDDVGKLTQLVLGSPDGSKQVPGDPLPIPDVLAPETRVPNLYGKLLRFEKKISLLDIIKEAFQEALGNVEGDLYYDKSTGVITYLVGRTGYRVIPLGDVVVFLNQLSAASVSASSTGAFSLASRGIQMTLSGAVGYFSDLQQALKGIDANARVTLRPNGVLTINTGGNHYSAMPGMAASLPENPTPLPGFESDANGLMIFRDHLGAVQTLFPAFYDLERLNTVVSVMIGFQGSSVTANGNGTVTLDQAGKSYTLAPDYPLRATPEHHLSKLWWTEGDLFYLHNADNTAQAFRVR